MAKGRIDTGRKTGVATPVDPITGERKYQRRGPLPEPTEKIVARYQPVTHVVTDGNGHFIRVDECNCTLDEHSEPTSTLGCPVHGSPA